MCSQDGGDVMLEAQLAGEKGFYDCPIKLFFYGPSDPAERSVLEEKLKKDKLVKATELKKTKKEAEARRRALGLVSGTSSHGLGSGPVVAQKPDKPEVSMATLLQNSEAVELRNGADAIKKLAIGEDQLEKLPKAKQPEQLKSQLLPYQLQVRLVMRSVCVCVIATDQFVGSGLDDLQGEAQVPREGFGGCRSTLAARR